MRIAFLNSNRRREGGVETYINTIISALHEAGHEILYDEIDRPLDRASIRLPQGCPHLPGFADKVDDRPVRPVAEMGQAK